MSTVPQNPYCNANVSTHYKTFGATFRSSWPVIALAQHGIGTYLFTQDGTEQQTLNYIGSWGRGGYKATMSSVTQVTGMTYDNHYNKIVFVTSTKAYQIDHGAPNYEELPTPLPDLTSSIRNVETHSDTVYITSYDGNVITSFNRVTNTTKSFETLDAAPYGICRTPSGKFIVSHNYYILVYDSDFSVLKRFAVTPNIVHARGVACFMDCERAYVSYVGTGQRIHLVDATHGIIKSMDPGRHITDIDINFSTLYAFSADQKLLFYSMVLE